MNMNAFRATLIGLAAALVVMTGAHASEITYQGQLKFGGAPFTGTANLEFRLFNQLTGGTQVGPLVTRPNWPVEDGLFQVDLDFGTSPFDGSNRYLEVRVNGTPLVTRQAVRAVPLALHALNGGGGGGSSPWTVDGSNAVEYLVSGQRFRFQPVTGTSEISPNVIIGHAANSVSGHGSAILSGGSQNVSNTVQGNYSLISGGRNNQVDGNFVTVSGGSSHIAQGVQTTVGGGTQNQTTGTGTTIAGGRLNQVSGLYSAIGGGLFNIASEDYATVGGGYSNEATGRGSTVSGGGDLDKPNIASGDFSVIGGGRENLAAAPGASVGGGVNNQALAGSATVGGGSSNAASGPASTIGGGENNQTWFFASTVGGGIGNFASDAYAAVAGGLGNTASAQFSSIAGGHSNCAGGHYSWAGGRRAKVRPGFNSGFPGTGCAGVQINIDEDRGDQGTFIWADSQNEDFVSTGENQFLVRAAGGVGFGRAPSDYFVIDSGRLLQDSDYSFGTGALRVLMNDPGGSVVTMFRILGNGGVAIGNSFNSSGVPERGMRIHGLLALNSLGSGGGVALCRNSSNEVANCGSSSERYKFDIEDLENPMALVNSLRPVRYRWIDGGEEDIGLIAEEVAEQAPALAIHFDGQVEGVKYDRLAAVLLGAVQQQHLEGQSQRSQIADLQQRADQADRLAERLDELQARNETLVRRNAELESRLLALEAVLLGDEVHLARND